MKNSVFIASLVLVILLISCNKEPINTTQGLNGNVLLNSVLVDTFSLFTSTFEEDSIVTSNSSSALLGEINDPIFGNSKASFYTEFNLSGLDPDFGDINTIAVDSFVLGLEYKEYYGEISPMTFEVYELNERIYLDTNYYAFSQKNVKSTNIVDPLKQTLTPKPTTNTVIDGIEVQPQLRLHLDTNVAKTLINEADINPSTFSANEDFLNFFKGLYIRGTTNSSDKGAIYYFNLNDPLSKLTIYYRQAGIKKSFDLFINENCADFNAINSNYTQTILNSIDNTTNGGQQFFAQANKFRAHISFPGIDNLPKNCVIHEASLELPVSHYSFDGLYPSSLIVASTRISSEDLNLYSLNVSSNYSEFSKKYVLDLRDYVQQLVSNNADNFGIYVNPAKMVSSTERIVFNGMNTNNKAKPKLKIIYTVY